MRLWIRLSPLRITGIISLLIGFGVAFPFSNVQAARSVAPRTTKVAQPPSAARFIQVSAGGGNVTGSFACGVQTDPIDLPNLG